MACFPTLSLIPESGPGEVDAFPEPGNLLDQRRFELWREALVDAAGDNVHPGHAGTGWAWANWQWVVGTARYGRVDLLGIDELGYMELDKRGAELLFQVLTEREEKNSVAIASNASFSGWTTMFTDPRPCAAIVDRLTLRRQHHRNRHRLLPTRPHPSSAIRLIHTRWVRITPPIGLE